MKLIVNKKGSKLFLGSIDEVDTMAAVLSERELDEWPGKDTPDIYSKLSGLLFELLEEPEKVVLPYKINLSGTALVGLYKQVRKYTEETADMTRALFVMGSRPDLTGLERQKRGLVALSISEETRTQIQFACIEREFSQPDQEMPS